MLEFNFQISISGFSTEATLTEKESKDRGEIFKVSYIRAKISQNTSNVVRCDAACL